MVHQQIRAFECDQCEKTFTRQSHLKGHVNVIHQKIRPFECDQCKKTFALKQSLNLHIQSNCKNLKKKYKCKECENSFVNKSYLKYHMNRVHLKIKPLKNFVCNECGASLEKKTTSRTSHE